MSKLALCTIALIGVLLPAQAYAQRSCDIVSEIIIRLRPPSFGNSRSWDILFGDAGYDRFSDIVMIDNDKVVLAGDYTEGPDDGTYKPMLVQMDYRGRTDWENREKTTRNHPLIKLAKTDSGLAALGEITDPKKGRGIFLAHYGLDGKLKRRDPIFENKADIDAVAVVPSHDKKGYIVAAQFNSRENLEDKYGLLFKVSHSGAVLWRRAYRPGIVTFFHNLHALPDESYMASGQIRMEDGRLAGWGVKLDENGAIQWQQIYPRGKMASLTSAGVTRDGGYVFSGEVEPSGGGRKSGWLLMVDAIGKVKWQRYYTGDYNYIGHDLISYPDGRTDLLIAGKPLRSRRDRPHVFLLTVSPQGTLMNAKAYVDGQGAGAKRLLLGPNKNRFFVGAAQTIAPDDIDFGTFTPFTFDAWLIGVPGLDPYDDPCMVNPLDDIRPVDDPF